MIGGKPGKDSDEKRFNETVQRMLKTPPKPHQERHDQQTDEARKRDTKGLAKKTKP